MMPKSITEVTSAKHARLERAGLRRRGPVGPRRHADAHGVERLRAPQGERRGDAPRTAADGSVEMFTTARPTAPATSGQGPVQSARRRSRGRRLRTSAPPVGRAGVSATWVIAQIAAKSARLTARPTHQEPSAVTSVVGANAGVALQNGACAVPITEPAMNAASVTSIRVLPPPTAKSVPEAQPPPSCMPRPKMNAPTITEHADRRHRAADRLSEERAPREQREEHRAGQREHHHLRA